MFEGGWIDQFLLIVEARCLDPFELPPQTGCEALGPGAANGALRTHQHLGVDEPAPEVRSFDPSGHHFPSRIQVPGALAAVPGTTGFEVQGRGSGIRCGVLNARSSTQNLSS